MGFCHPKTWKPPSFDGWNSWNRHKKKKQVPGMQRSSGGPLHAPRMVWPGRCFVFSSGRYVPWSTPQLGHMGYKDHHYREQVVTKGWHKVKQCETYNDYNLSWVAKNAIGMLASPATGHETVSDAGRTLFLFLVSSLCSSFSSLSSFSPSSSCGAQTFIGTSTATD